ncbi:MAG TPA: antitoxin VapB family protein [Thermoplasmata archaeon]|nr:antitoxin VapB family protein [Thermoplasmata archaeon]
MSARTVALDDEAYELLKRSKQKDETFSDAVKRLARPRRPLSDFAGRWADMDAAERETLATSYRSSRRADERREERIRRSWSG